jgi:hypothetical protein
VFLPAWLSNFFISEMDVVNSLKKICEMVMFGVFLFLQSSDYLKIIWCFVDTGRRQRGSFDSWSQARRSAAWSGELLF